ncbi:hypothetical protein, partial [Candidatus Magnetaquicoccus inordinatus]|uniref:hypothetical protein n=1 Tax=Candidatus Magnetaquicoccus inordinatus TaxID=2496818 RepID=UPI001D0E3CBA
MAQPENFALRWCGSRNKSSINEIICCARSVGLSVCTYSSKLPLIVSYTTFLLKKSIEIPLATGQLHLPISSLLPQAKRCMSGVRPPK